MYMYIYIYTYAHIYIYIYYHYYYPMLSYGMFLVDIESCQVHPRASIGSQSAGERANLGSSHGQSPLEKFRLEGQRRSRKTGRPLVAYFLAKCRDDVGRSEHVHQYS